MLERLTLFKQIELAIPTKSSTRNLAGATTVAWLKVSQNGIPPFASLRIATEAKKPLRPPPVWRFSFDGNRSWPRDSSSAQ
eukprot:s83_g32.t1